jgi:hypothetical protein
MDRAAAIGWKSEKQKAALRRQHQQQKPPGRRIKQQSRPRAALCETGNPITWKRRPKQAKQPEQRRWQQQQQR